MSYNKKYRINLNINRFLIILNSIKIFFIYDFKIIQNIIYKNVNIIRNKKLTQFKILWYWDDN